MGFLAYCRKSYRTIKNSIVRHGSWNTAKASSEKYSDGVLRDTQAWLEIGIVDFYPNLEKEFVRQSYKKQIENWENISLDNEEIFDIFADR